MLIKPYCVCWVSTSKSTIQLLYMTSQLERGIHMLQITDFNNHCHAGLFHVDISTDVCTRWNSMCTFQWISQQPMIIEYDAAIIFSALYFVNSLPVANVSLYSVVGWIDWLRHTKIKVTIDTLALCCWICLQEPSLETTSSLLRWVVDSHK